MELYLNPAPGSPQHAPVTIACRSRMSGLFLTDSLWLLQAGEGETPKIPPKIPMGEMIGQRVEELPWSMGSKFLSNQRLSPEEQEAFQDW